MARGIVAKFQSVTQQCGIVTVQFITGTSSNLYLAYDTIEPTWLDRRIMVRGTPRIHALQYAVKARWTIRQAETGNTVIHTFTFPWPSYSSRVYYIFFDPHVAKGSFPKSPVYAIDLDLRPVIEETWGPTLTYRYPWVLTTDAATWGSVRPGQLYLRLPLAANAIELTLTLADVLGIVPPALCDSYLAINVQILNHPPGNRGAYALAAFQWAGGTLNNDLGVLFHSTATPCSPSNFPNQQNPGFWLLRQSPGFYLIPLAAVLLHPDVHCLTNPSAPDATPAHSLTIILESGALPASQPPQELAITYLALLAASPDLLRSEAVWRITRPPDAMYFDAGANTWRRFQP